MFSYLQLVSTVTPWGKQGDGQFGPDLTHLMSRETLGAGTVPNTTEKLGPGCVTPNHERRL